LIILLLFYRFNTSNGYQIYGWGQGFLMVMTGIDGHIYQAH